MEKVIVRLSTMAGWQWEVEPDKEKELLQALNRLGRETPTEALTSLAERMEEATKDWAPGKIWERHEVGITKLAVMAKKHGVALSRETAIGLALLWGADWCQDLEEVYQPTNLRKLASAMECLIRGGEPEPPPAEPPEVTVLKRKNKRLKELYRSSITLVRRYQEERERLLARVEFALLGIKEAGE